MTRRSWGCGGHEAHPRVEPELADQRVQVRELGFAVGTTGAADDHELGARVVHLRERADREVGALESLDATDEQQQRSIAQAELSPRRAAVAGREHQVVDAGCDHFDAVGVGAVEAHELLALLFGRRDDEVGAAHDLGFDARAQRGVTRHADLCLHALERVERGDEREVELVLQLVPDRARHPVVRVQHVVRRAGSVPARSRRAR